MERGENARAVVELVGEGEAPFRRVECRDQGARLCALREVLEQVEGMERSSIMACPAKVEPEASLSEMIKQVLQLMQRDGALSKKQAWF